MPAYNAEKYIAEAIESILNQTFKDFEFIIIDDASTDNTWDIIQEYAQRDKKIVAIKNDTNLGIAGNRNKLVSLARGEYIVWQDADDISLTNRIKHQLELMESNSELGIVGGWLEFFNEKGETSIRKYPSEDTKLRKNIFRFSPVAQPGAMIRKKCLDEMGQYDLRYPPAEDLDMSFRIGSKYKFSNLQEIVIRYRESSTSATFTKLKTIELNTLEIRKKFSNHTAYKMSFSDKIYNAIQQISIYIIPPKMKIKLFNLIRNS